MSVKMKIFTLILAVLSFQFCLANGHENQNQTFLKQTNATLPAQSVSRHRLMTKSLATTLKHKQQLKLENSSYLLPSSANLSAPENIKPIKTLVLPDSGSVVPPTPGKRYPLEGKCGMAHMLKRVKRLYNGTEVLPHQFPWFAQVMVRKNYGGIVRYLHNCGSAAINDQWLVTMANCTELGKDANSTLADLQFWFNTYDMRNPDETVIATLPEKIIRHPGYVKETAANSITLIKLTRPITEHPLFDEMKSIWNPICMPKQSNQSDYMQDYGNDMLCYVTAIGGNHYLLEDYPSWPYYPRKLEYMEQELISFKECRDWFDILNTYIIMPENKMCAVKARKSACQGDGGSPLHCRKREEHDPRWTLEGTLSGSFCPPLIPVIYDRVANYVDWIHAEIAKDFLAGNNI